MLVASACSDRLSKIVSLRIGGLLGYRELFIVLAAAYMVRDFLKEGRDDVKVNEETVGRLTGILVSAARIAGQYAFLHKK